MSLPEDSASQIAGASPLEAPDERLLALALENLTPFATDDTSRPRLVWHPQVHQHFGERCVFFVIRLREQKLEESMAEMERLLGDANVGTYSIYVLYGNYDVLIRAWTTAPARERLERLLDSRVGLVALWEELQVEQVRYLWAGPYSPLSSKSIEIHRDAISLLAPYRGGEQDIPHDVFEAARGLCQAGLLHLLPGRDPRSIKIYVALQPQPGGSSRTRALEQLIQRLYDTGLSTVSLYSGIGFASHLIKVIVTEFHSVLDVVQRLEPIGATFSMRTTSMIIATPHVRESDELVMTGGSVNPYLLQIAGVIGGDYEHRLLELDYDVQEPLTRLFLSYSRLLATSCDGVFVALIRAVIDRRVEDLYRELVILMHFEFVLKQYLKRHLASTLDETQISSTLTEVVKTMPKYKMEAGENPDIELLSIGTAAQLIKRLADDGIVTTPEPLSEALGDGWAAILERYTKQIRNPIAHGTAFTAPYAERFLAQWREYAELVCKICVLYTKLLAEGEGR
jgi:hypothetical protein